MCLCEGPSAIGSITNCRECFRTATNPHPVFTRRKPEIALQRAARNFPYEFKQFIGKEMRLSQVEYASRRGGMDSQQILSFYMGKNRPERKNYIMENLVVTVEE